MVEKMDLENIIVVDEKNLEKVKKRISEQGKEKFHVLADFDRTLTQTFVDGEKIPSIISELRKGDYISKEYAQKAQAFADKYHPIEFDPNISINEKKGKMHEWWTSHFDLLIKSGLNKSHIERIINEGKIRFREGAEEFLDFLYEKNVPLVILSSAGLGGDSISMFLEKYNKLYDNVHIISNSYEWDLKGNAIGFKKPIIHVMNKDETILKDFPEIFNRIKDRKNVLLLGDSLGDLGMVKGFDYNNLIKVGFLNDKVEENLKKYKENFEVIITNDGSFDYVNKMVKEIVK